MYEKRISHEGLRAFRVVRGWTPNDVAAIALHQRTIWDERWKRIQAAEKARSDRARRFDYKEDATRHALKRTTDLRTELEQLDGLLDAAIAKHYVRNWNSLKRFEGFPVPPPPKPEPIIPQLQPLPPALSVGSFARLTNRLPILKSLSAEKQRQWAERTARIAGMNTLEETRVSLANQAAETQFKAAMETWLEQEEEFDAERLAFNQGVDDREARYSAGDPDALLEYWSELLSNQSYSDSWPEGSSLNYIAETKILIVDYELPPFDAFPKVKEVRYVATRNEFRETPIADAQRKRTYDDTLYRIALASLFKIFNSHEGDVPVAAVFNGWVQSVDKATGAEIHPCVMSIQVNKKEFLLLNLANVDPRLCFKKLKGVCGSRLAEMTPVQPVLSLNKQDARFVPARDVGDSLNSGTNLAAMDWLDFENLIRELFEKEFSQNGGEVRITQASRDGGVDAVAFDPDPIRGGKIVIQAKRYTNVVGLSAVRDLYGTVHNEGATKGILVTTSSYGPDAYEFAKGKPLTLLSGSELLYLLQRHGYKAMIDIADAKRLLL